MKTYEEIIELVEEGIKSGAFALVISYRISGIINKKDIKYEFAFSQEEKDDLEEINSTNWRRVDKTYMIPTIKSIAEAIVKNRK